MGYNVISLGGITFKDYPLDKIKEIAERIKKADNGDYVIKCEASEGYIDIELSGNKGVSYDSIYPIIRELMKNKVSYDVNLGEYSEVGDGLYIDSDDYSEAEINEIIGKKN